MDRRIDERIRKPRRAKGTPFFRERNYWASGVLALAGLSWFLMESVLIIVVDTYVIEIIVFRLTPAAKKIRANLDKLDNSEEFELKKKQIQIALTNPIAEEILVKARERIAYKDVPKEQGFFSKFFSSGPDL